MRPSESSGAADRAPTRPRRIRRRLFLAAVVVGCGLVGACSSNGTSPLPLTGAVQRWAEDEVCARNAGNQFGTSEEWTVHVDLKNVEGRPDGWYEIAVPLRSVDGIGLAQENGSLALAPLPTLEVSRQEQFLWRTSLAIVTEADAAAPIPAGFGRNEPGRYPDDAMRLGARVIRDDERNFTVRLYGEDRVLRRWVLLGEAPVGRGSQSSLRRVGEILLLPPAWVGDGLLIVTCPIWLTIGSWFGLRR